jgi:hypothetical protein
MSPEGIQTWREVLREIISEPQQKQYLCEMLGIHPLTLQRWCDKKSEPRPQHLKALLKALPDQRERLIELIEQEHAESLDHSYTEVPQEIYSFIYADVLSIIARTAEAIRTPSICNYVLDQALKQLDPQKIGMELVIIRCMPPSQGGYIRSLRASWGMGTSPWREDFYEQLYFCGLESLAGHVVSNGYPGAIHSPHDVPDLLPVSISKHEASFAAAPLFRAGRIAGCLLATSTLAGYFQKRLVLVNEYAKILALAFDAQDFYEPDRINLCVMPAREDQQHYLETFHFQKRVAHTVMEQPGMTKERAEDIVRRALEQELQRIKWQEHATSEADH